MLAWGNKATWASGIQVQLYPAASWGWVEASPVKQRPQAEPTESGPLSHHSSLPQPGEGDSLGARLAPCLQAPGFGLRARGTRRSPEASASTKKVQDSHKETPGPGCAETGPAAPHSSSQAGCGVSSGPAETRDRLPLLLLLELLVGSIQVLQHLQQAGSCFSLPGQGIGTGPWEGDKGGPQGLSQGRAGCQNPHPVAFSGSRFALCRENP